VALIAAGAVIAGVLLEQVVLAQSAFKVVRLRDRITQAESEHQELLLEAATLESPGRVERYARAHLGMIDPDRSSTETFYVVADIGPRSRPMGLARRGPSDAVGTATGLVDEVSP